jgi:FMN phosphatase YigB (HAD superfamily)
MIDIFLDIRSVGFDLDNTLYANDSRIDDLIRNEIAQVILEKRPELETIGEVRAVYDRVYDEEGSWTRILRGLDVEDPSGIMCRFVSNPEILEYIDRDDVLAGVLERIDERYHCFLITNSPRELTYRKLDRMGIDPRVFGYISCGDDPGATPKVDGRVFRSFLERSAFPPGQHVYVGDGLSSDVTPARSCGMKTIAVGSRIPEADCSVDRVHEIEKLLL